MESFQPDTVDIVRIPAIRGQLRWWWRALYQVWEGGADSAAADRLFAEEARLWGGVGLPSEAGEDEPASPGCRSRVRITAKVLNVGQVAPAGWHKLQENGLPRTVPSWRIGRRLAYALFPLQCEAKARQGWGKPVDMPTRYCREQLSFRLDLAVMSSSPGTEPDSKELVKVLASIWAWIFFGGLGARTRRGFGALELTELPTIGKCPGLDDMAWTHLFQGPAEDQLLAWLEDFQRTALPQGRAWPFEIVTGRPVVKASEAHEEIVEKLRNFRQEPDIGRDKGRVRPGQQHTPPSQSRWPEPHLLRVLATPGGRFPHDPPPEIVEQVKAGAVGAPRAAFGLPIQVQFKDQGDKRADATLLPPGAGRWPSPLLLRPLRSASGKYWPAAVILPFLPPEKVELKYVSNGPTAPEAPVLRHAGARDSIGQLLKANHGNALQAFATWLQGSSYQRISLPKQEGSPHA